MVQPDTNGERTSALVGHHESSTAQRPAGLGGYRVLHPTNPHGNRSHAAWAHNPVRRDTSVNPNELYLRIFDHAGATFVFSAFAIVSAWLASRRYIGHRRLLIHVCAFCIFRSVFHAALIVTTYHRSSQTAIATTLLTLSTIVGLSLATHILVSIDDILNTLVGTEAADMVRKDHKADRDQVSTLMSWMAAENKQNSIDLLSEAGRRGNPT
jgi:hypothetical protein